LLRAIKILNNSLALKKDGEFAEEIAKEVKYITSLYENMKP